MMFEEAIHFLKNFIESIDNVKRIYNTDRFDEDKEAYQLAIKALEKMIPKKPDFEADGYADGELVYDTWICPCCCKHYEVEFDDFNNCPECGQAIDWRVDND